MSADKGVAGDRETVRWVSRVRQTGRSTWLLFALILMLIALPVLEPSIAGRVVFGVINTAILAAGAYAVSESRRTLLIALAFAIPALGLQWAHVVGHHSAVGLPLVVTMILFYTFTIAHSLVYVLRPGAVTGNKLHAAMATYIMLALLWSFIFTMIDALAPGSFDFMGTSDEHNPLDWREFMFFSFVTLTTTGYGDIVPIGRAAQTAAVLEQLAGTFYIAILIARLAGLYESAPPSRPHR
jgi:hypothetical protein